MTITITNWKETFENADTRKRQRLAWIHTPSGCDSKGYRTLMRHGVKGLIALGVFQGFCQLTATLAAKYRGQLVNSDGSGMAISDIAEVTRMPEANIKQSLALLEKAGWISLINQQSAGHLPVSADNLPVPAGDLPVAGGFVQGQGQGQGQGKGEGKGQGQGAASAAEVVEAWNSFEILPKARDMTDKRRAAINSRLKESFFTNHWREALTAITLTPFLVGKNARGWKANFDWFIKPDSVLGIIEGKYDGGKSTLEKETAFDDSYEKIES